MAEHAGQPGASLGARLREKLPEILIEAASVVVALLLALALQSWNEDRQERLRADAARAAILAELRANREELADAKSQLDGILADLKSAAADDAPDRHQLSVNLGISLLSAAAWHAALATRASQEFDFAWMTRVAKVYELQDTYVRVQGAAVDQLSSIAPQDGRASRDVARLLLPRLAALAQIADGLERNYDEALGGRDRSASGR